MMTNTEIVLDAFNSMGGSMQHNKALMFTISQRNRVSEEMARQLIEQAIKDGVLSIDTIGAVRKT